MQIYHIIYTEPKNIGKIATQFMKKILLKIVLWYINMNIVIEFFQNYFFLCEKSMYKLYVVYDKVFFKGINELFLTF